MGDHSMGELTKKKEQGRWSSVKENGHEKRVQQGKPHRRSAPGRYEDHSMGELTKKKELGRRLSMKENGHKKRYNRTQN